MNLKARHSVAFSATAVPSARVHPWPCVHLIDKKGYARYRWDGELNYNGVNGEKIMRRKIEELLGEKE